MSIEDRMREESRQMHANCNAEATKKDLANHKRYKKAMREGLPEYIRKDQARRARTYVESNKIVLI